MKNREVIAPRILGITGLVALVITLLLPFMIGCSKEKDKLFEDAKASYNEGIKHKEEGELEKAREKFEDARRVYQELAEEFSDATAQSRLGDVNYQLGDVNYQLKNYEASRKNYEVSRKTFRKLLKEFPKIDVVHSNEARRLIADSYRLERKYDQAYLAFDTLTGAEFHNFSDLQADAMFFAASSLQNLKKPDLYDEALARYAEFLTRFPNSKHITEAYFDRGEIYFDKKDYVLARSNYDRALKSTDNRDSKAKFQLWIGHTYYKQRNFEKALTAYNLLLREYPKSKEIVETRRQIAHIHRREDKWDKAIAEYKLIIKDQGDDRIPITLTGGDGLRRVIDIIALSHFEIGTVSNEKEDFEEAFKRFVRIVKKPKDEEKDLRTDSIAPMAMYHAMRSLNNLWGELGSEVKSVLREILDLSPEVPLETEIGKVLEMFAHKYINGLPEHNLILSAEAQFQFARILRTTLEQYDKAATEYAKLQDYSPIPHPRLDLIKLKGKYYEGLCYNELSRLKDANKAYQETITLFNTIFQPLIDNPSIDAPNIDKRVFEYCIQTALEYAEKVCDKIKNTEYGKKACDKIEEARRKLKNKNKAMEKSDASNNPASPVSEQIAQKASGSTVFITIEGIREYENGQIIDGGGIDEDGEIVDAALGTGSGFFVEPNQIATNYHVITPVRESRNKADDKNEVVFKQPLRGTARIVGTDREYAITGYTAINPDRDLAILKVKAFGVKPISLGNSEKVNRGESVYAVGNPLGLVNVVSEGQISSIQWTESIINLGAGKRTWISSSYGDNTPYKLLMMTAPISPGNSGGPVINGKGEVIGVSTLVLRGSENRAQNLNFAVPVNYLKTLLKRIGPPKPLSDLEVVY